MAEQPAWAVCVERRARLSFVLRCVAFCGLFLLAIVNCF